MNRAIAWVKNIRPVKILTVFLAGIFLFLTQACSNSDIAGQPQQPDAQSAYTKRYDPTKDYPLSSPAGGINNFSDVDPRAKEAEKASNDRADALSRNAQKNVDEKSVNSVGEYVDNIRKGTPGGAKNVGGNVGSSTEEVQEGVVSGTKRGIENIKENIQNAGEDLSKKAQNTLHNTEEEANRAVRKAS